MRTDRIVRARRRRPARWARFFAVLAAALAALLCLAPPASAHSSLISSSPAADAVLPTPPTSVELVFNEDIRDFQLKIAITVGDHDPVEIPPTVDGTKVEANLAGVDLPTASGPDPVAWKIGYRVVSADGHPVSGLVPFSVGDGPAPSPTAASPTSGAPDRAAGDSTGGTGSGVGIWWWVLAAVVLAAGAGVAVLVVRRRAG